MGVPVAPGAVAEGLPLPLLPALPLLQAVLLGRPVELTLREPVASSAPVAVATGAVAVARGLTLPEALPGKAIVGVGKALGEGLLLDPPPTPTALPDRLALLQAVAVTVGVAAPAPLPLTLRLAAPCVPENTGDTVPLGVAESEAALGEAVPVPEAVSVPDTVGVRLAAATVPVLQAEPVGELL